MTQVSLRETLDRNLQQLMDDILVLGSMVEQALLKSVEALKRQDLILAQRIYDGDIRVNTKRFEIENDAMVLIATQQPMARDLRILASTIDIATELERIGDYAKGIAKICLMMGKEAPVKPLVDIPRMAETVQRMLHDSLKAFVNMDLELAMEAVKKDDEVDHAYHALHDEIAEYILFTTPK